jgi:hypothetical protein
MENHENTLEFQNWVEALRKLDDHINSLTVWDDYAEKCQREYDNLLKQDPRLKEK